MPITSISIRREDDNFLLQLLIISMPRAVLPFLLVCLALLVFRATADDLPPGCYESNYTSSYTRCDMTFLFCYNYVQLKECVLRKCERYIRAGDCRLETAFMESEAECYQNCCGSNEFDEGRCDQYNQAAQQVKDSSVTGLTITLIIISIALLLLMIFFSIRKLRCCDKTDPFMLIKYNVKWRKTDYEDTKCEICRTYGSMMVTPCKHYFHISCFQDSVRDMACPACSEVIKERIRIYCFLCREKSFKVKINKPTDIAEAIAEGRALHIDECPREIRSNQNLLKT